MNPAVVPLEVYVGPTYPPASEVVTVVPLSVSDELMMEFVPLAFGITFDARLLDVVLPPPLPVPIVLLVPVFAVAVPILVVSIAVESSNVLWVVLEPNVTPVVANPLIVLPLITFQLDVPVRLIITVAEHPVALNILFPLTVESLVDDRRIGLVHDEFEKLLFAIIRLLELTALIAEVVSLLTG